MDVVEGSAEEHPLKGLAGAEPVQRFVAGGAEEDDSGRVEDEDFVAAGGGAAEIEMADEEAQGAAAEAGGGEAVGSAAGVDPAGLFAAPGGVVVKAAVGFGDEVGESLAGGAAVDGQELSTFGGGLGGEGLEQAGGQRFVLECAAGAAAAFDEIGRASCRERV